MTKKATNTIIAELHPLIIKISAHIKRDYSEIISLQKDTSRPFDFASKTMMIVEKIIERHQSEAALPFAFMSSKQWRECSDPPRYTCVVTLQGMHNFMRGLPFFSVIMRIFYKDTLDHTIIFEPIGDVLLGAKDGGSCQIFKGSRVEPGLPENESPHYIWEAPFPPMTEGVGRVYSIHDTATAVSYVATARMRAAVVLGDTLHTEMLSILRASHNDVRNVKKYTIFGEEAFVDALAKYIRPFAKEEEILEEEAEAAAAEAAALAEAALESDSSEEPVSAESVSADEALESTEATEVVLQEESSTDLTSTDDVIQSQENSDEELKSSEETAVGLQEEPQEDFLVSSESDDVALLEVQEQNANEDADPKARQEGVKRPFSDKSFNQRGEDRSHASDDRRGSFRRGPGGGERRGFSSRAEGGERRGSFSRGPGGGERRGFSSRSEGGERRSSFGRGPGGGERRGFSPRSEDGERRSSFSRGPGSGERRGFSPRSEGGERRSSFSRGPGGGERRGFSPRSEGGERRSSFSRGPGGGERRGFSPRSEGGERRSFADKPAREERSILKLKKVLE